jgi:hypothetical protein
VDRKEPADVTNFVVLQIGLEGIQIHGPWPSHEAATDALDASTPRWQQGTDSFWVVEVEPPVDEPSLFE